MKAVANSQAGISYVEVLVAVVLIALIAVPASDALRGAIAGTDIDTQATTNQLRLKSKLEEVLAGSFTSVSVNAAGPETPSSYSDTVGTTDRRIVYVSAYDGDNADTDNDPFTGTESDLLWVQVQIEGGAQVLQSLKSD